MLQSFDDEEKNILMSHFEKDKGVLQLLKSSSRINNLSIHPLLLNWLPKRPADNLIFILIEGLYTLREKERSLNLTLYYIRQLIERKLFVIAEKTIVHEIKLARKLQKITLVRELLILQYGLAKRRTTSDYFNNITKALEAIDAYDFEYYTFNKLDNHFRYILKLLMLSGNRITPVERESVLKELKQVSLLEPQLNLKEPLTQILLHLSYANCYYLLNNTLECSIHCEKLNSLWKKHIYLSTIYPNTFFRIGHTLIYFYFSVKDYKKVRTELTAFRKKIARGSLAADAEWDILQYNSQLKLANKSGNYEELQKLMRQMDYHLKLAHKFQVTSDILTLTTSGCISYFVLDDFDNALTLILEIKKMNEHIKRDDVYYFSIIFHLMILYEQRKWFELDLACNAAYHKLYYHKKARVFEKEILLFIRKLPALRAKAKEIESLNEFLEKLKQYGRNPVEEHYYRYFNFYGWLMSKKLGITYREYVQRQLHAHKP